MEQLLKQDPIAMGMLGKQVISEQVYRPLTYLLTAEEADKKIFYNLLTHEMIAVKKSSLDLPETRNYLIENWYLVPEDHDDQQLVDECREVMTLMDSWPKKIHIFHVFTTLDCNARCFYCFENRVPGSRMTLKTASSVIEYMARQAEESPIKIVWFGGEPLFNYPVIDFISDGLRNRGLRFESDMISNGFLFNADLVEKAKACWNLKSVQITLDGTRQVYKKVKAYVPEVVDPFEIVLQNISSLLRAGIKVQIRLNLGLHNYRDIGDLVDFLYEKFKGENNLYIYAKTLFGISDITEDKKAYLYEFLDNLNDKLDKLFGKKKEIRFARTIRNNYCMASGREAVTILPDGKVGICEGLTNEVLLGDIYTKEIDFKVREEFGQRLYYKDKCRLCPMYPNCYIVNGCPIKDSEEGCDSVRVQIDIRRIKERMKIRCRLGTSNDNAGLVQ